MSLGVATGVWAEEYAPTVQVTNDAKLGLILTDAKGMTMYLYTKDDPGVTNCYGGCATAWPPLLVEDEDDLVAPDGLPGELGLIKRTDTDELQVTYNGWPLYGWVRDHKPGDTTGQDVGGVWYVLNPQPSVLVHEDAKHGDVLVGANQMTLYTYTKDEVGVTNCYGRCAINWPPLLIGFGKPVGGDEVDQDDLGTIKRTDGTTQVTYNGWPLYYWVKDQKPGDVTGDGVGGVWKVATSDYEDAESMSSGGGW